MEASEPRCARERAVLVSGILKGLQCMSFMYHMRGKDTGSLAVYRFGDGVMKSRLWHRRGQQGDMWHEARITLPCNSDSYQVGLQIWGPKFVKRVSVGAHSEPITLSHEVK